MRTVGRVILAAIILIATGLLMAVASFSPEFLFSFYTEFSLKAMETISGVTGLLPFALWEWLLVLAVLWALYCLVRNRKFLRWLSGVLVALSLAVFLFTALWGLNHFAPSVAQRMQLSEQPADAAVLRKSAEYMARRVAELEGSIPTDEQGRMEAEFGEMAKFAHDGYAVLAQEHAFFGGYDAPVKKLLSGQVFSYLGFTGVFVPVTAECNVNPQTYCADLPFTMCHELAHGKGIAAEDDANFCAFLACISNPDPRFQYSGWYNGFLYTYNALYRADPQAAAEVAQTVSDGLLRQIELADEHYAQYDSFLQPHAEMVNDLYLKTFQEEEGVESYDRAADLIAAWYAAKNP